MPQITTFFCLYCWILLVFELVAFSSSSASARAEDLQKPLKCTVFHQVDFYAGRLDIVVAANALRFNLIDLHAFIVLRAPDWRVVLYNDVSKKGMDMPIADYLAHQPTWNAMDGVTTMDGPSERVGPIKYAGLDCIKYGNIARRRDGTIDPKHRYYAESYIVQNKKFPKEACLITGKFAGDRNLPGLVVYKMTYADRFKRDHGPRFATSLDVIQSDTVLQKTKSVESREFPLSYFDYPLIINQVKRECDVITRASQDEQRSLLDLMGD